MTFAENIAALFQGRETTVARDLKLNFGRLLTESALAQEDAAAIVYSIATLENESKLKQVSQNALRDLQFDDGAIAETAEVASIMSMLNMYYRFRHFVKKEEYSRQAGLRMTALAKPVLGKTRFETLAFAISIVNGCETCVASHEQALRELGVSSDTLHDVARLAAVTKAAAVLFRP